MMMDVDPMSSIVPGLRRRLGQELARSDDGARGHTGERCEKPPPGARDQSVVMTAEMMLIHGDTADIARPRRTRLRRDMNTRRIIPSSGNSRDFLELQVGTLAAAIGPLRRSRHEPHFSNDNGQHVHGR
jgi:hypothetical protein